MEDVELLLEDLPPLLGDMSALDDAILGAGPVPAAAPSGGYLSSSKNTYLSSSSASETLSSPDSSGSGTEDYEEELELSSGPRKRSYSTVAKPAAVVPRPSRRKRTAVLLPQSDSSVTSGDSSFAKPTPVPQIRELQCGNVKATAEQKQGKQSKVAMIEERKARNRASAERSRQRRMQYTSTLEGELEVAEARIAGLEKSESAMRDLLQEMLSSGALSGSRFEFEAKSLCASSVVGAKMQPTLEQLRREEQMAELAADHHLSGSERSTFYFISLLSEMMVICCLGFSQLLAFLLLPLLLLSSLTRRDALSSFLSSPSFPSPLLLSYERMMSGHDPPPVRWPLFLASIRVAAAG